METEIQNKMLFSSSYSTRDLSNSLSNNVWALYNESKVYKSDQYHNSFMKRQVIGGYSGYEKEQLRQTIMKHELIFKNQLEELHRLYKKQRELMNEIKRRVLYPPPELPFADLSYTRPPISATYTHNMQPHLSFKKKDIMKSRECEYPEPKQNMFPRSLLNNGRITRDVNTSIGNCNDLKANSCLKKVKDVFDLNEPVQAEENHMSGLNNKNEAGESLSGLNINKVDEASLVSPSNENDIETRGKRTVFGVEFFKEIEDKNVTSVLPTNSKKIFGFCIVPSGEDSEGLDLTSTSKSSDLVTEKGINSYVSGLNLQIDLNLSINEEDIPLVPPLSEAIVKIATTEIDLETPAVLESDTNPPTESNFSDDKFSENIKQNEESKEQNEDLDKEAAEAIVAMSSSSDPVNNSTTNPDPLFDESLHWFANLVSSYNKDEDCEEDFDGIDYFEYMTLNLKETNIEEYINVSPMYLDYQKNEEKIEPVLSKRPKRGQGKRGKQRKDFQKDVLPSIVSLARHEVAEDLHLFEELFKACGFVWQPNVSKRSNAKSGRGRRRSGGYDTRTMDTKEIHTKEIVTKAIHVCEQFGFSGEVAVEEAAVTRWGKRMRRLPRRRSRVGGLDHT